MADFQNIKIDGFDELKETLKTLPDRIGRNVLRGTVSAGAAVVRNEARQRAPVYTGPLSEGHPPAGTLKKSIYQKQIRELSSLVQQTFYVGVRVGKNLRNKKGRSIDAYYWRFVEFGTKKMSARPFLRPALTAKANEALEAMRTYMRDRLDKELAKK